MLTGSWNFPTCLCFSSNQNDMTSQGVSLHLGAEGRGEAHGLWTPGSSLCPTVLSEKHHEELQNPHTLGSFQNPQVTLGKRAMDIGNRWVRGRCGPSQETRCSSKVVWPGGQGRSGVTHSLLVFWAVRGFLILARKAIYILSCSTSPFLCWVFSR
jgi:hypothetical protein